MRKCYMLNGFCDLVFIGVYEDLLQAKQYVESRGWKFLTLMDESAAKAWLSRCKLVIEQTS